MWKAKEESCSITKQKRGAGFALVETCPSIFFHNNSQKKNKDITRKTEFK